MSWTISFKINAFISSLRVALSAHLFDVFFPPIFQEDIMSRMEPVQLPNEEDSNTKSATMPKLERDTNPPSLGLLLHVLVLLRWPCDFPEGCSFIGPDGNVVFLVKRADGSSPNFWEDGYVLFASVRGQFWFNPIEDAVHKTTTIPEQLLCDKSWSDYTSH